MKLFYWKNKFILTIVFIMLGITFIESKANSEYEVNKPILKGRNTKNPSNTNKPTSNQPKRSRNFWRQIKDLFFPHNTEAELRGTNKSGTSFGQCKEKITLFALIPGDKNNTISTILTAENKPTLWFYSPDVNSTKTVEYKIVNTKNGERYDIGSKNVDLESTSVFDIKISKDLQMETDYMWNVSIICDPKHRDKDILVSVPIKLINVRNVLPTPEDRVDRVRFYAEKGLWAEALNTTIKELYRYPEDKQGSQEFLMDLKQSLKVEGNQILLRKRMF
ncbi:MAG: DUF928 domain-containing protein [Gloeotrichia echinulata IR180]